MDYNHKLLNAEVVDVYNKLIIDAKLDNGKIVPAFCSAPEIADMCKPGIKLLLKRTSRPKRLVKYNISFSVKRRYVIPAVLQWHLNRESNNPNSVVYKIR